MDSVLTQSHLRIYRPKRPRKIVLHWRPKHRFHSQLKTTSEWTVVHDDLLMIPIGILLLTYLNENNMQIKGYFWHKKNCLSPSNSLWWKVNNSLQTFVAICNHWNVYKQACKVLRKSHLKCKRGCIWKHFHE
jgi:hypothetical protein